MQKFKNTYEKMIALAPRVDKNEKGIDKMLYVDKNIVPP